MAVLNQTKGDVPEWAAFIVEAFKAEFADDVWRWFDANAEREILTVKKFLFSFTFRVKHCRWILEQLVDEKGAGRGN